VLITLPSLSRFYKLNLTVKSMLKTSFAISFLLSSQVFFSNEQLKPGGSKVEVGSGRGGGIPYLIIDSSFERLKTINYSKGGGLKRTTLHGIIPSSTRTRTLILAA
jgi:hypothetical protein